MSRVKVYAEGGGDGKETRAAIRIGLEAFFRAIGDDARARKLSFRVVACGGRDRAYAAFCNALAANVDEVAALLVDAELPMADQPIQHLRRHDGWDFVPELCDRVFVMSQVMETWIIADSDALARYYGQHFGRNALPRTRDLESVTKQVIARALNAATQRTSKKRYEKIGDASRLLQIIDPEVVRRRCPQCERAFTVLGALIAT